MPDTAAGIDRGVKAAAVTSDGEFFDRSFLTAGETVRYRRLQQQLARTNKGSANRARIRARMNKIMGRVTSRRADFLCWHRLELALTSAARYTGTRVVKVNPAYTLQRCSACGFVTEGNRESQAVFWCKAAGCGHTAHADVNAAVNIKHAAGHAVSACANPGNSRSVKQEPVNRAIGRTPS